MSKSLEALENLVHCKSETKCKECKHKYRCTMERDYNTIKQDLERVKETEFNYHCALAFCEASKEEKQELNQKIKQLEKENQELKQDLKDVLEDYKDAATIMFKLDKAIEILKKFNFKLGQYGNGEYYIIIYYAGITIELILTQEEYDLLKEVLEC